MRRARLPMAMIVLTVSATPATAQQQTGMTLAPSALVVFQPLQAELDVVGWSRDSIHIAAEHAGTVRVELERFDGGVRVHERRDRASAAITPRYTLYVPSDASIRVTMQAGRLSLRRLVTGVHAGVVDGSIRGDSLFGPVALNTVTGPVRLSRSRGDIDVRSVNGDVALEGIAGSIRAKTTSGALRIVVEAPSSVDAESYSGRIEFRGGLAAVASTFATHSVAIDLRLLADTDATLFLTSVQGRTAVDCGNAVASPRAGEPVPLGSGGSAVEVVSFSGNVRVVCGL